MPILFPFIVLKHRIVEVTFCFSKLPSVGVILSDKLCLLCVKFEPTLKAYVTRFQNRKNRAESREMFSSSNTFKFLPTFCDRIFSLVTHLKQFFWRCF